MTRVTGSGWGTKIVIGCLAAVGACAPITALAQQAAPSGAAVEVGGVSATGGLPNGASPVSATSPATAPASAGAAQTRPLVLPNTGAAPVRDEMGVLGIVVGGLIAGAGIVLRRRVGRPRVGG